MARYHFADQGPSRAAIWSARLALFSMVTTVLSVLVVRSGTLESRPALATVAGALACAVFAIFLALIAFIVIWRQGVPGLGRAVLGLGLGLVLLAYPGYLGYRAYKLPPVIDVTTDPIDPPRIEAAARDRSVGTAYAGRSLAERQRTAYPSIGPAQFDMPPKTAFDVALGLINKHKWQVLNSRAPAGRIPGVIEAVDRSTLMGFRDDVVIRVSALGNGSRVDVRSASRNGFHDFGSNATRVDRLLEEIDTAMAAVPEPKAEPEPKKPQPKRAVAPKR